MLWNFFFKSPAESMPNNARNTTKIVTQSTTQISRDSSQSIPATVVEPPQNTAEIVKNDPTDLLGTVFGESPHQVLTMDTVHDLRPHSIRNYVDSVNKLLDGILVYSEDLYELKNLLKRDYLKLKEMRDDPKLPQGHFSSLNDAINKLVKVNGRINIAINLSENKIDIARPDTQQARIVLQMQIASLQQRCEELEDLNKTLNDALEKKTEQVISTTPTKSIATTQTENEVITKEAFTDLKNKYEELQSENFDLRQTSAILPEKGAKVNVNVSYISGISSIEYLKGTLDIFEKYNNDFPLNTKKEIVADIKNHLGLITPTNTQLTVKHQELLERINKIYANITKEKPTPEETSVFTEAEIAIKVFTVKLEVFNKLFAQEVIPRMLPLRYLTELTTQVDSLLTSESVGLTLKNKKDLQAVKDNIKITLGKAEGFVYKLNTSSPQPGKYIAVDPKPPKGSSTNTENLNKLSTHAPESIMWSDNTLI